MSVFAARVVYVLFSSVKRFNRESVAYRNTDRVTYEFIILVGNK